MKTMKRNAIEIASALAIIAMTAIALALLSWLKPRIELEGLDKPSVPLRSTDIDPATIKTVIHEKPENMLSPSQWIEDAYNPARDRKIKHAAK